MNGRNKSAKRLAAALLALVMLVFTAAPALAEVFSAIVTAETMTVYGEASMTQRLGTLPKNTVVRVSGYSNSIAKIAYNGRLGYANISDMKRVDAVAKKVVTAVAADIFQSPQLDSAKVTAPAGTRLYLLASSGEWAMVERNGNVGYVQQLYLTEVGEDWATPAPTQDPSATQEPSATPSAAPTQESGITVRTYDAVTVESTKVYKSASDASRLLGTLKAGVQVTVRATSSTGWAYIELNGRHGFCKTASLKEGVAEATPTAAPTPTPTPLAGQRGVVSADSLPVYKEASDSSQLLGTLKKGRVVNVINWNSQWAYIELNGNYGFCAVSGLARADDGATPGPTATPSLADAKKATVTAASLAVYQMASTGSLKLGTLKKGKTVNVLQSRDGWAYIELNGNYGFCDASGLKLEEGGVPEGFKKADFTATVIVSEAKVYASASAGSEKFSLLQGAQVQVRGYNSQWACIERDGSYGFVAVSDLSKASYSPIDSDGAELQTLLKALLSGGYFDGEPSTLYNAAAISAIKRFQDACNLEQTGIADETMLRIVYGGHAPVSALLYQTLSSGTKGDYVSRVQARLYALGYLSKSSSLDGEFGSTTVAAVKLFQNASGITASGKADPTTLKAMYSTEAKKLPAGSKAADASTGTGGSGSSTYLSSMPAGLASTTASYSSGMSNAEKLEYAIYITQAKLGRPYVYGAAGPEKFDCSGLTLWAFRAIGVSLQRTAYSQGYDSKFDKIEGWSALRRGDLVFFNTISDSDLSDHVGIYLGDGYFIHASSGAHKVVVSNLTTGYYGRVFSWGRRILK